MIKTGKVVTLAYTLKDEDGKVLDEANAADPFMYLHGGGQIVPGLESALEGLDTGAKKDVVVSAEEGYGEYDEDLCMTVKRSQFPAEMDVQEGMQFETQSPDGQGMVFTVESMEGDEVEINGNHPLAGEALHFSVEVLGVRDATEEEKKHGHAHGPDGHGHH